ncbi:hypothetical protein [Antarcticimicrobium luteum]|uniref:hypothetical protein n=1 Tax=Antarcticimicrobium luteum TaxID=2547397 RepID=UPI001409CD76|nr:hypothetical protein [Antarcticimicrobium luteum]
MKISLFLGNQARKLVALICYQFGKRPGLADRAEARDIFRWLPFYGLLSLH